MREKRLLGDVAASKAYPSAVVDAVIVSENSIRIIGSNDSIRMPRMGRGKKRARARG
jgi:hypothetical protein